ncbi:hypothetical protein WN944_022714 [Citrus x changshan-huyou]|uniref:Uncharacterized protein n=1 Tax=Citrus x changshan-huyou TaxID=2935761 RepID=A0AAP0N196_9ROSI
MERQNHLFGLRLRCPWALYPLFLSAAKLPFDEKEQDRAAQEANRGCRSCHRNCLSCKKSCETATANLSGVHLVKNFAFATADFTIRSH